MKPDIHPTYVETLGHLYLWQHLHDPEHRAQRRDPRRCVLQLPPVLHGQAEDSRHRRTCCSLREAVCGPAADGQEEGVHIALYAAPGGGDIPAPRRLLRPDHRLVSVGDRYCKH